MARTIPLLSGALRVTAERRAAMGFILWAAVAAAALADRIHPGPIEVLFLLGPLVVVPLAFPLAAAAGAAAGGPLSGLPSPLLSGLEGPAALAAALSFWAPWAPLRAALTVPWLLWTAAASSTALLWRPPGKRLGRRPAKPARAARAAALLYLPVGAAGLLVSRAGWTPLGYEEPILLLFAVHFHFAAFASCSLASALGREVDRLPRAGRFLYAAAAPAVAVGPALIALGFVLGSPALAVAPAPFLTFAPVILFAAGLEGLALLHLMAAWAGGRSGVPALPRLLLAGAGLALAAGAALAVVYSLGDLQGRILLDIPWMAKVHGTLNGLGFSLGGALGWRLRNRETR